QIIDNVPDNLATEIPRVYLLQFPDDINTVIKLNKKKWKPQQNVFSNVFIGLFVSSLSSSVLQGFTCTTVRSLGRRQIKNLVRACRRKGTNKVPLVETQLTCMYNQIKEESDATSFSLYPPDVLLYYDYSLVPRSSCRSYFQELADADFSVFSPALRYKRSDLFNNARSCLGITSKILTEDNVSVLGNMCCMLDGSYIQNSHPSILERLKNCPDLTVEQTSAVVTLLTNGKTPYGVPSTWNEQTLKDLGMFTLYLPSTFYLRFDQVSNTCIYVREQRRRLKREIRQSITKCTAGVITQVAISDPAFPFDYSVNQFNNCLSVSTVKDNLDAITEKVDDEEYLRIVLQKLKEVKDQVQLLSAASRVATVEDIRSWNISKIDTLAALMDYSNGGWDPILYLAIRGNRLGSAELNIIGGPNLCSLEVDIIRTISSQNFSSVSLFQLIRPYIGELTFPLTQININISTQSKFFPFL
uniref:Mesothelin a n=1 Tax=Oryzias melastigma TaxID=30732 RepID=A0A3B3DRT2_ORYME